MFRGGRCPYFRAIKVVSKVNVRSTSNWVPGLKMLFSIRRA